MQGHLWDRVGPEPIDQRIKQEPYNGESANRPEGKKPCNTMTRYIVAGGYPLTRGEEGALRYCPGVMVLSGVTPGRSLPCILMHSDMPCPQQDCHQRCIALAPAQAHKPCGVCQLPLQLTSQTLPYHTGTRTVTPCQQQQPL
jgi:hypothetical protein